MFRTAERRKSCSSRPGRAAALISASHAPHPHPSRLRSSPEPAAVAASYDFSSLEVIIDVGGATGNMLAHIVSRYPLCRGVLFDRPHVVADALAFLRARGIENRIRIESGDFFTAVPPGGDAYILSHIIHDWNEEQCLTILSNCRKAMKPGAKLLIMEFALPEGDDPHIGKLLDMTMLVVTGGEERTANEYRMLLGRAGLTMNRVVLTGSDVSIVEAEIRNDAAGNHDEPISRLTNARTDKVEHWKPSYM